MVNIRGDLLMPLLEYSKAYMLAAPFYSGAGHILLFHRVCPENKRKRISWGKALEVTPEYLEMTLRFFTERGYKIISLDDLYSALRNKRIGKKFVIFTFDDGYADNLTYAYPVFKKYNAPFAIYVTTGFPDKRAVPWWYLLEEMLLNNNRIRIDTGDQRLDLDCTEFSEKEKLFQKISSLIMNGYGNIQLSWVKKIFGLSEADIFRMTGELMLSWEQIKELSADPLVTLGAHTVHHFVLSKLPEAMVRSEMDESKNTLESNIKHEVRHFSYPFGNKGQADRREYGIAEECGFRTAATTRTGNVFFEHGNHLNCLPRITMGEELGIRRLKFLASGLTHCINNRFRRVVTV